MGLTGFQAIADRLNRRPAIVIALLTVLFAGLVIQPMQKILWHDELFTFYIANSPTAAKMINSMVHIDWQPPLIFVTAWLSQHLFGVNEFGTRLPSTIAFYAAGIGVVFILKRRIGVLWASIPVMLFWFSFYFKYAAEARPYGLLTAFFVLSVHCYLRATDEGHVTKPHWYIAGLFAGNMGMMLSHILAPFSMMPFGVAELVRTWQRRKIDLAMWFAILAPLGVIAIYLPMMHSFQQNFFPYIFQASFKKIAIFYAKALRYVWPSLLLGVLAAAAAARFWPKRQPDPGDRPTFSLPQIAFAAALLLPPILVNLMMMRSHGAFWERYCITTALTLYVACSLILGWISRWQRPAALAVFIAVLLAGLGQTAANYRPLPPLHTIETVRPDLPLVDASGLAFLEMDHYERPVLLNRLFYLTDRQSAIRYAHATLFEDFAIIHNYFPIRAHVQPYIEFVRQNKHFLVFGTPQNAEDWLFDKLQADQASVQKLQGVTTPYRDYQVFEVTLP